MPLNILKHRTAAGAREVEKIKHIDRNAASLTQRPAFEIADGASKNALNLNRTHP